MSSQSPLMEEPDGGSEIIIEKIPLGVRLTLQFLRLTMVVMVVPLVASGIFAIISLILGSVVALSTSRALVFSLMGLGSFLLMLALTTGAAWMECHLNQSDAPFAATWVAGRPGHPARKLILPPLGCIAFYGYLAVVLWTAANIGPEPVRTPAWPVVWMSAAVAAHLLHRYLKVRLPG